MTHENPFLGKSPAIPLATAILPDNTIDNNFDLSGKIANKKAVLFFYPLDFTFVCPSELITLDRKLDEFNSRNTELFSISIDSHFSHLAYKKTPRDEGGIGNVGFTMVSDINKKIASYFQVLTPGGLAFRGTVILDKNGIIRHYSVNDLPIGRNIDEILRILDAIDYHEAYGEVCPANWTKGTRGMIASLEGVSAWHDLFNKNT
jgi:peroxiredoxin (alkyl hydroperoxide reductase subunit C)